MASVINILVNYTIRLIYVYIRSNHHSLYTYLVAYPSAAAATAYIYAQLHPNNDNIFKQECIYNKLEEEKTN